MMALVVFGAMSALCMPLFAAKTLYVVPPDTPGTTPTSPYGSWETAATNIADAIAAAAKGTEESHDTILVASGTYNIDSTITIPRDTHNWLEIRSANIEIGEEDREGTVLDGGSATRIMDILSPAVKVSGFTFQNGYLESETYANNTGGAAIHTDKHKVAVRNCVFRGNRTKNLTGTCICCVSYQLSVTDCVFSNNTQEIDIGNKAVRGLAIYCQRTAVVSGCLFDGNSATGESVDGMLVGAEAGSASGWVIDNCTFLTNAFTKTGSTGKGLKGYVRLHPSSEMRNCRFSCTGVSGVSPDAAYGSILSIDEACTISNSVFTAISDSNTTTSDSAIRVEGSNVTFANCSFTDTDLGSRNLVDVNQKTNTLFRNCLFANNRRSTSNHLLIRLYKCPATERGLVLENCTIANNTDNYGTIGTAGDCFCTNTYVNTVITGLFNPAASSTKAIARNSCFGAIQSGKEFLEKTDCIMISDIPGGDLKFVDAANGDYRLQPKSPLRERGVMLDWMTAGATDLDGNKRVNLELPDIGCYESQFKPSGLALFVR